MSQQDAENLAFVGVPMLIQLHHIFTHPEETKAELERISTDFASIINNILLEDDHNHATLYEVDGFGLHLTSLIPERPLVTVRIIRKVRGWLRALDAWAGNGQD